MIEFMYAQGPHGQEVSMLIFLFFVLALAAIVIGCLIFSYKPSEEESNRIGPSETIVMRIIGIVAILILANNIINIADDVHKRGPSPQLSAHTSKEVEIY